MHIWKQLTTKEKMGGGGGDSQEHTDGSGQGSTDEALCLGFKGTGGGMRGGEKVPKNKTVSGNGIRDRPASLYNSTNQEEAGG